MTAYWSERNAYKSKTFHQNANSPKLLCKNEIKKHSVGVPVAQSAAAHGINHFWSLRFHTFFPEPGGAFIFSWTSRLFSWRNGNISWFRVRTSSHEASRAQFYTYTNNWWLLISPIFHYYNRNQVSVLLTRAKMHAWPRQVHAGHWAQSESLRFATLSSTLCNCQDFEDTCFSLAITQSASMYLYFSRNYLTEKKQYCIWDAQLWVVMEHTNRVPSNNQSLPSHDRARTYYAICSGNCMLATAKIIHFKLNLLINTFLSFISLSFVPTLHSLGNGAEA